MNSISCILPAAKTNIENLNLRKFQNTSLLELKIKALKKIDFSEIIVSTNDKSILEYLDSDIKIDIRKDELCVENVDFNEIIKYYCHITQYPILFHSTINCPFVSLETMKKLIYLQQKNQYDTVCVIKKNTNKFFKINNIIRNCNLDNILQNVGLVFDKNKYLESGNLFSGNYIFLEIEEIECIIIKSCLDFIIAESLYFREINQTNHIKNYMLNSKYEQTKILDCTIRDSGYLNNWNWSLDLVKAFIIYMGKIGVEYCEIGFYKNILKQNSEYGVWWNLTGKWDLIKELKNLKGCKLSVMTDVNDKSDNYVSLDDIPEYHSEQVDLIRVFTFIDIFDKSLNFCLGLKKKGYTVSLNVGHCTHLSNEDISNIKKKIMSMEIKIDYLYFADSLGMLTPIEINNFMIGLKDIYPIKNGFHNHNNNGTVFGNVVNLIDYRINIIDATISGLGKNGGNLNLEQIIMFLVIKKNYDLNLENLLIFIDYLSENNFLEIELDQIKNSLQQFMGVHSSYLLPIKSKKLIDIYRIFSKLENKKKNWN